MRTTQIILTDVDQDITLLDDGFSVGENMYLDGSSSRYQAFLVTDVEATAGTITNQTGGDVSVVVGGETITVANGNTKPVGSTASSDAYLENLTVTADSSVLILDPSFANPLTEYASNVGNETASVAVMAQPSNSAATVSINGQTADAANSYTVNVALSEGENSISIVVTAPDGTTQKTYTVTITRNEAVPKHITISTAAELMDFAEKINSGAYLAEDTVDMLVELTADIDMSGYEWIPIGNSDTQYFAGTFDGNDHTISSLTITHTKNDEDLGLFGATTADIRDVHVTGTLYSQVADAESNFGAIAGFAVDSTIIGCTSAFEVTGAEDKLFALCIGGVVGQAGGGRVENCVSYSNILGKPYFLGGVIGAAVGTEIINCRNEGNLTITDTLLSIVYAGGIIGSAQDGTTLDHCVNNGSILCSSNDVNTLLGGICGQTYLSGASADCMITNCTNNGKVSGGAYICAGVLADTFPGDQFKTVISSCINNGEISSSYTRTGYVSGLTADGSDKDVLTACISLGSLSATSTSTLVHPVAAVTSSAGGFTISNNYYDNELTIQDTNKKIPAAVTDGSTGKPLTDLETETFIQKVNSEGGNFRLDEDGHIEVIPLSYTLTVVGSYADVSGAGEHEEGEQVTIDAGSRPGYSFEGWTATSGTIADPTASRTTFTMPDEAATVTASWAAIPDDPDPSYSIKMDIGDHGSVHTSHRTAEKGETVTLTVTPDDGYVLSDLTVTDSSGKTIKLTSKGSDWYTFEMPARAVTVTAEFVREAAQKLPFTDVPNNAWYYDGVAYVYEHGLMAGTSAATFGPDVTTSRSMIATILWRLAGSPVVNYAMDYTDVAQDQWYSEAVRWATSEGVVTGYGNGLFGTDDPITREQLATMLWRYAQTEDYDLSIGEDTNILSYSDVLDLSQWAMPAMQWACGAGIITGTGDGSTLSPQGQATRAQAAVMLTRFCEEYVTW